MTMQEIGSFLFLIAGVVTAVTTVLGALWLLVRAPLREYIKTTTETHRMVAVNGHKDPENPTLPDRLAANS